MEVSSTENRNMDKVKESVMRMLKYMRSNSEENLELEVRVGQFTTENDFQSGYLHDHLKLINRMLQRLQHNTEHTELKKTWTMEPKYMMMRCEYAQGLRKTCRPSFPEEYMMKKRIGRIDVLTDRQYHLRFSLSKETKVDLTKNHPMYETVKQKPPNSVRYIYRANFTEKVPALSGKAEDDVEFNWEIAKVSESASNKKKSTESPATYHCEIELKTKLLPIADQEEENQRNSLLADLIISRARSLLGTTYIENQTFRILPPAKLTVLTKDV
jgi:hypothetical protein